MHYQNYGPLATDTCVGLCWKKKSEVTLEQVAVKTQFEQKKKSNCLFNCILYSYEAFQLLGYWTFWNSVCQDTTSKNDSSVISSAHWNHRYLIVNGNYFFNFWIKVTYKPKTNTL